MNSYRMGVIGDPIAHTLSPAIHTKMAEHLGLCCEYTAHHVKNGELGQFVERTKAENFAGFNVTIPHKKDIMDFLDECDPYARKCGAVNTVKIADGKLKGYNTDGDGLYASLKQNGILMDRSRVLLLGAGGAALSICQKALDVGAKVMVLCRSPKKAAAFAEKDGVTVRELSPTVQKECAKVTDIIINATPLGMEGIPDDFWDFSFLDETEAAVYDIVYKPAETSLMRESRNRGLRAFNGLGMLINQAIYAFSIFIGQEFDFGEMASYLEREIGKIVYTK
ncbi:MAG: shikimate dehydrogenase [Clostridiales bacterium]|nr:MAG: shikimate dehydrogenase [Clostridiales bacterium]